MGPYREFRFRITIVILRLARVLVGFLALAASLAYAAQFYVPPADWLLEQDKILSAPDMEGRRSGTPGADRAAAHISGIFREAGLAPGGDAGTYLQSFTVPTGIRLGPVNGLRVLAPFRRSLALGQQFTPLAVSSDGRETAEVVFVGYGITAPDLHYDDYVGVNARGKIVLAMTGEPRSQDPASPFRRPEAYHYSERGHKIINAREHGARGILLVTHPATEREKLPGLSGISQSWGILAAAVTRSVADSLLAPSGKRLSDLTNGIDQNLMPQSFSVARVKVRLEVNLIRKRGATANVVGILPGTDAGLRDEAIVVGAHYDHLGRGGEGSLAPDEEGTIHPGADDNASGTAAVMALAKTFVAAGGLPRTVVFVAFAGEELGLLGSSHYVRHPAFPLGKTALIVNLDMVGRLRDGKLYINGVDSGTGLRQLMTGAAQELDLSPQLRGDPFSPSDHTPFYTAGRPVLFLFTGAHSDYHRPSDTWEKVNAKGMETVTTFAAHLIAAVASQATPPAYVKVAPPTASGGTSSGGGYGPLFGIVPDFGEGGEPGVKVSGVRSGTPAEKAGVRGGDVIVKFAGVSVKTLEDLTFALRLRRPGDRVEVVIVRDGQERTVQATLEERR